MTYGKPARTTRRLRIRGSRVAGLLLIAAAIAGLGSQLAPPSSSEAASPIDSRPGEHRGALGEPGGAPRLRSEHRGVLGEPDGAVTEADGVLPNGVSVFDDRYPGIVNLDPDLLQAVREAATDAGDGGIEFFVHSGWRSPEYQDQLFREAVSEYGSGEEAARWVATAETSAHVSGDAIDIDSDAATAWLSEHGTEYGLCQIYRNEPWHYELRPQAIDRGCPQMYADATQDPRTQQ